MANAREAIETGRQELGAFSFRSAHSLASFRTLTYLPPGLKRSLVKEGGTLPPEGKHILAHLPLFPNIFHGCRHTQDQVQTHRRGVKAFGGQTPAFDLSVPMSSGSARPSAPIAVRNGLPRTHLLTLSPSRALRTELPAGQGALPSSRDRSLVFGLCGRSIVGAQ